MAHRNARLTPLTRLELVREVDAGWPQAEVARSLTRFSGQFTCRHHAASAAAAGLLSYSTGLRSPIEV